MGFFEWKIIAKVAFANELANKYREPGRVRNSRGVGAAEAAAAAGNAQINYPIHRIRRGSRPCVCNAAARFRVARPAPTLLTVRLRDRSRVGKNERTNAGNKKSETSRDKEETVDRGFARTSAIGTGINRFTNGTGLFAVFCIPFSFTRVV